LAPFEESVAVEKDGKKKSHTSGSEAWEKGYDVVPEQGEEPRHQQSSHEKQTDSWVSSR
jgi:hypothetical protein